MRTFRKVIAGAVFALACSGSVAVAGPVQPCDLPCWKAYQACMAGGVMPWNASTNTIDVWSAAARCKPSHDRLMTGPVHDGALLFVRKVGQSRRFLPGGVEHGRQARRRQHRHV